MKWLIPILLLISTLGICQQSISVLPFVGIHFPQSHIIDRGSAESSFKLNSKLSATAGFGVEVNINKKYSASIGISAAEIGYGYKLGPVPIDMYARYKFFTGSSSYRIPLSIYRKLRDGNSFDLEAVGGVSFIRRIYQTEDNTRELIAFESAYQSNKVINRNNVALLGGLRLRFYKRAILTVVYYQGFFKHDEYTIDYRFESSDYNHQAVVGTLGSTLSIQVGYPILLWKKEEVEQGK